jgi:hypothetical protein
MSDDPQFPDVGRDYDRLGGNSLCLFDRKDEFNFSISLPAHRYASSPTGTVVLFSSNPERNLHNSATRAMSLEGATWLVQTLPRARGIMSGRSCPRFDLLCQR